MQKHIACLDTHIHVARRPPRERDSAAAVRPGSVSRSGPRSYTGPTRVSLARLRLPLYTAHLRLIGLPRGCFL